MKGWISPTIVTGPRGAARPLGRAHQGRNGCRQAGLARPHPVHVQRILAREDRLCRYRHRTQHPVVAEARTQGVDDDELRRDAAEHAGNLVARLDQHPSRTDRGKRHQMDQAGEGQVVARARVGAEPGHTDPEIRVEPRGCDSWRYLGELDLRVDRYPVAREVLDRICVPAGRREPVARHVGQRQRVSILDGPEDRVRHHPERDARPAAFVEQVDQVLNQPGIGAGGPVVRQEVEVRLDQDREFGPATGRPLGGARQYGPEARLVERPGEQGVPVALGARHDRNDGGLRPVAFVGSESAHAGPPSLRRDVDDGRMRPHLCRRSTGLGYPAP